MGNSVPKPKLRNGVSVPEMINHQCSCRTVKCGQHQPVRRVPTSFVWKLGGDFVSIVGSFSDWNKRVALEYSEEHGVFQIVIDVFPGNHEFRFIVDGQWRIDPNLPWGFNEEGLQTNCIRVTKNRANALQNDWSSEIQIPDCSESPPPRLPQYLCECALNVACNCHPEEEIIPVPNICMLNHLFTVPKTEEGMICMGMTERWKHGKKADKFCTFVIYKPMI